MSRKSKVHLTVAICVLAAASAVTWLIAAETSPLYEYFADSVLLNLWRGLHLIPFLASVFAGGHAGNDFVFFTVFAIQWLVFGLAFSVVVSRFRNRESEVQSIFTGSDRSNMKP